MDALTMLQVSVVLFAVAAVGGLVMAGIRFGGKRNPPAGLALVHGLLAGAGLTLLVYAAVMAGVPPMAQVATGLLLVAALGGVVLNLGYHQKGIVLPKGFVVVHALLAVGAFVLLLPVAFG